MDYSVVIPCKNAEHTLPCTLNAILSQIKLPKQVIIVDGHSIDNTIKIAEDFRSKFEKLGIEYIVVQEPPHEGNVPAIGRNFGAQFVKTDVIWFLDPDCIPERKLSIKALEVLKNPKITIYSVVVRDGLGTLISKAWHFLQLEIEYDFAPSRCMFVKKWVFDKVGGFDETLPTGEDNDFSIKVKELGYEIVVDKESIVLHIDEHARSIKGILHLYKWYGIGKKKLAQRYPDKFKKYKPYASIWKNHVKPILKAFKQEGLLIGLACILIKCLALSKLLT